MREKCFVCGSEVQLKFWKVFCFGFRAGEVPLVVLKSVLFWVPSRRGSASSSEKCFVLGSEVPLVVLKSVLFWVPRFMFCFGFRGQLKFWKVFCFGFRGSCFVLGSEVPLVVLKSVLFWVPRFMFCFGFRGQLKFWKVFCFGFRGSASSSEKRVFCFGFESQFCSFEKWFVLVSRFTLFGFQS
jgi:hypothetical protein